MDACPSGRQFQISWRGQQATIVEAGGGIRQYAAAGQLVLDPYLSGAVCGGAHGAPLIPRPNRLADGRCRFDGVDYQVALTEPEKRNAIHGFVRWRPWQAVLQAQTRVTMATRLFPMDGYPFLLHVETDYALGGEGLSVAATAASTGTRPCPYGTGQHPYLSPGAGLIDDCTLQLDAGTRILTDPERQLPAGTEDVDGTGYDFREARLLGAQRLDFAFTGLARDAGGRAWARLGAPDGRHAELWADEDYPVIELYPGDTPHAWPPPEGPGYRADDLPAQRLRQRSGGDPPGSRPGGNHHLGGTAPVSGTAAQAAGALVIFGITGDLGLPPGGRRSHGGEGLRSPVPQAHLSYLRGDFTDPGTPGAGWPAEGYRRAAVLPGDPARPVRPGGGGARPGGSHGPGGGDDREAVRPRPGLGPGPHRHGGAGHCRAARAVG